MQKEEFLITHGYTVLIRKGDEFEVIKNGMKFKVTVSDTPEITGFDFQ